MPTKIKIYKEDNGVYYLDCGCRSLFLLEEKLYI